MSKVAPLRKDTSFITQAPQSKSLPALTNGIIYVSLFSIDTIKRMGANDFVLDSNYKIGLKWSDCIILLFYSENQESHDLAYIFAVVSQQVVGPVMAACNLYAERDVAKAFTEIAGMGTHMFHWAGMQEIPFIMVYRNGIPVGIYNGDPSVTALTDWVMTLACKANYYDTKRLTASVQVEGAFQLGSVPEDYTEKSATNKIRHKSIEYHTDKPIRGYNPNMEVSYEGSEIAEKESEARGKEQKPKVEEGKGQGEEQTPTTEGEEQPTTEEQEQEPTPTTEGTEGEEQPTTEGTEGQPTTEEQGQEQEQEQTPTTEEQGQERPTEEVTPAG